MILCGLPSLADQSTPDGATKATFEWYQQAGDSHRKDFHKAEPYLAPELYGLLNQGFQRTPSDEFWVDFDPFVNAQVPAKSFKYGEPYITDPDNAFVIVRPYMELGDGKTMPMPDIKVHLKKLSGKWQVANLIYTGENSFELLTYLKDGLAKAGGEGYDTGPSDPEHGQDLAGELLGTWVHKATSETAGGEARPLQVAIIKWTFKPDGKCDFYQKVGNGDPMIGKDRTYTLEGSTITLGGQTKYTIVENSGNKMIWKNHRLGDFYHVIRE